MYEVPSYFTTEIMYRDFLSGAGYVMPWCQYYEMLIGCVYE
jgi:hypothetical protein